MEKKKEKEKPKKSAVSIWVANWCQSDPVISSETDKMLVFDDS
jgi:hypothetical protein